MFIICIQIVVITCLSYSAYKEHVADPQCYDRRTEKCKLKNKNKIKIRHDFPVHIPKVQFDF
jgi:hypothetical protein